MHLYVVRHGETWANAEHRYLGSLDPELTARAGNRPRRFASNCLKISVYLSFLHASGPYKPQAF